MLVNLDRTHIKHFNKAISDLVSLQREDAMKGKISDIRVANKRERLESIRQTLHYVGSVSLVESEYSLIKDYVENGIAVSNS